MMFALKSSARAIAAAAAGLTLSGVLPAGTAMAQTADTSGVNAAAVKAAATPEANAVDALGSVAALAAWGRANRDPEAMIVAARMLRSIPVAEGTVTGVIEGPVATTPAPQRPALTPAGLLGEARTFARGNAATLTRIRQAEAATSRGVISSAFGRGAVRTVRDVSANSTWRFTLDARGGAPLRILAVGDGDTDVDMRVRDQNGNVVCEDLDFDHRAACAITPAWTGRFTVDVINTGSVWTRTMLVTN
jgi:hypothetical protein